VHIRFGGTAKRSGGTIPGKGRENRNPDRPSWPRSAQNFQNGKAERGSLRKRLEGALFGPLPWIKDKEGAGTLLPLEHWQGLEKETGRGEQIFVYASILRTTYSLKVGAMVALPLSGRGCVTKLSWPQMEWKRKKNVSNAGRSLQFYLG